MMWFDKKKKSNRIDPEHAEVIFRKMMSYSEPFYVRSWGFENPITLIKENEKGLYFSLQRADKENIRLEPGMGLELVVFYEGKEYEAPIKVLGIGKLNEIYAIRVSRPAGLFLNDKFQLTHLYIPPGVEVTYTSIFDEFAEAKLVNIGTRGIDVSFPDDQFKEKLVLGRETMVGFELDSLTHINCKARVLYFIDLGKKMAGLEFVDLEPSKKEELERWIHEKGRQKQEQDRLFSGKQWAPPPKSGNAETSPKSKTEILDPDFDPVFNDVEPFILLASHDEMLLDELGRLMQGSYGVIITKGSFQNLRILNEKYHPKLLILHENLGTISAFDLSHSLIESYDAELAILVMGNGEETAEKTNQAMRAGAIDYLVVDPLDRNKIYDKIEATIELISGS